MQTFLKGNSRFKEFHAVTGISIHLKLAPHDVLYPDEEAGLFIRRR